MPQTVSFAQTELPAAPGAVPAEAASLRPRYGLLAVYSVLIVLASLGGGMLPFFIRLTHTRMQTMISFVGGLMLGFWLARGGFA